MKRAFCKSRTVTSKALIGTKRVHRLPLKRKRRRRKSNKADDGIRTRDLRFTKPLLYQLSYVGAAEAKITSGGVWHKHLYSGRTNVSPISRRAIRSGSRCSADLKRSIGSR